MHIKFLSMRNVVIKKVYKRYIFTPQPHQRKYQFKMGLLRKIIKKYLLILEEEKKNNNFLFVFSTYLPVFLLKFRLGELVGCGIKSRIQRVPTWHTFDGPRYLKNKKYLKKRDDDIIITFFRYFSFLG